MRRAAAVLFLAAVFPAGIPGGEPASLDTRVDAWATSPHVKLFTDARAGKDPFVPHVARNEHVAFQIAVRLKPAVMGYAEFQSGHCGFKEIRATVSAFRHEDGNYLIPSELSRVRLVSDVTIRKVPPPRQDWQLDGPAQRPNPFPDALLETDRMTNVVPDVTRAFWIDLTIPKDAVPGNYAATVLLTAPRLSKSVTLSFALRDATLPDTRRFYESYQLWAFDHVETAYPDRPRFSDGWWRLMEKIAQNMADHRYTVVTVQAVQLAEPLEKDGRLEFRFDRLDRFVNLFKSRGIEWVHLYPIVERRKLWKFDKDAGDVVYFIQEADGIGTWRPAIVPLGDPRAERFHRAFLTALERHFSKKGWTPTAWMQVMDEEDPRWTKTAWGWHQECCPQLLDPKGVDWAHIWWQNREALAAAREGRKKVCLYVTSPKGHYPKECIEEPTLNQVLMRWLCFRWNLFGYGFWAYNVGWASPADLFAEPSGGIPVETFPFTGNDFIVYPGPEGPIDSIRHEAGLDGVEDVELLYLLASKDKAAADALAARMIPDMDKGDFVRDADAYERIRRDLLGALERTGVKR